jgi:hypothetical protein
MAVLLISSYISASLVVLPSGGSVAEDTYLVCITGLPLLLLGIAILLQVVIALSGMCAVRILTWSSSPFDVIAALVHHAQLTPAPLRCMCNSMTSGLEVGVHQGLQKYSLPHGILTLASGKSSFLFGGLL